MKNKYTVYGRIIAILNNDCPKEVSKSFTESVMTRINSNNVSKGLIFKKNYLNYAASVLIAITTSYFLVSYNENNFEVATDKNVQELQDDNQIIRRVTDDKECVDDKNNEPRDKHACN